MKKTAIAVAMAVVSTLALSAKKPLDHNSFDSWEGVRVDPVSNDGKWSAFEVNPQEGDGVLHFYNTATGRDLTIARGYNPVFTANSQWAVALIKPLYSQTRNAKIKKKKKWQMPQDSLAIVNLKTGAVTRLPSVSSFRVGRDGGDWVAYQTNDTAYISQKMLKDDKSGRPLVIRHLSTGSSKVIPWVDNYSFARNGSRIALSIKPAKADSTAISGVGLVMLPDTSFILLDRGRKFYGAPVFSRQGDKLAFTSSNDTIESGTMRAGLYLTDIDHVAGGSIPQPVQIYLPQTVNNKLQLMRPHSNDPAMQQELLKKWHEAQKKAAGDSIFVNQYSKPVFSDNGKRLVIGVAPAIAPNDTSIVEFERADLDIWRWDAPYTPPQEEKLREEMRKHTFPVVVDLATGHSQLLTHDPLVVVEPGNKWDADFALLHDPAEFQISKQWDYGTSERLKVVNVNDGIVTEVGTAPVETAAMSPEGKYVVWFDNRNYIVYDIADGKQRVLSEGVEFPLWDEEQDVPMQLQPYGIAGWTKGDDMLIVYDAFDLWGLDPKGVKAPVNLTKGYGRSNNLRFRYQKTDREERSLSSGKKMLLTVFNTKDKRNGYALATAGVPASPRMLTLEKKSFTQLRKAKDADTYAFQKADFSTSPNVYIAVKDGFANAKKVTDTNPSMKDYSWGTAQLEKWYAYNGDQSEGILYLPGDFDATKKYPMLVVFYERNSENLYRHYTMEPSWSWVNYAFYASRGYVIFVPDVKYAAGIPGESAYNYICSGVEDLCRRYPWIDSTKIGIDGQSWGGYQTAFLVTRTNMFACAGSGAPVANMTSAFGGIRWGTGDSRQAQYEKGQSRIGRNLWEAPQLYIANSPVFYADRVNTPLLIMHNDADGAVPWYQGIEMFMALRRLGKPVWMLQYNGEAHNIKARKNRKDITIRLQQFFDHYLKGAPEPRWMKEGISPLRKGEDLATDLIEVIEE